MADSQSPRPENKLLILVRRFWKPATWIISLLLVGYTLSIAPLTEFGQTLSNLDGIQIMVLILLNMGIISTFGFRWWWLLRTLGFSIPYRAILRYRLASFGVSYFTPGPQFGGEPLQVYYLKNNHQVPTTEALASLSLDKLLELLANFTFLALGLIAITNSGHFEFHDNLPLLIVTITLALLPWMYLLLLYFDKRILTSLNQSISRKTAGNSKFQRSWQVIMDTENQIGHFCQKYPLHVIGLMIVSGLVWAGLVFEYWLAISFLGAQLSLGTTLVFVVAARLAFLTPLPGGLGALEIGQALAARSLGYGVELGVSIGLLIRARDFAFGILGLLWGGILIRKF